MKVTGFALIAVWLCLTTSCSFAKPHEQTCVAASIPIASMNGSICRIVPGILSSCYDKRINFSGQCYDFTLVVLDPTPCSERDTAYSKCTAQVMESCVCSDTERGLR